MTLKVSSLLGACAVAALSTAVSAENIVIATVNNGDMIRMQGLTEDFTAKTGHTVEWVTLEENVLRQRVTTDISTKGGAFDIMTIGMYETPIWAKNGWLQELKTNAAYDVDDLQEVVARNKEARREIAAEAEGMLRQEGRDFLDWWDGLEAVPVANRLRTQLEVIREQELQKALSRMGPDLSARERKVVEALTKGIINKILHTPVTNLRAPQSRQQRHQAMKVLQDLFELHDSQD